MPESAAYNRHAGCAALHDALKASPGWSWKSEGAWAKGPKSSGPLWYRTVLRAGDGAYEWEFRAWQDGSLLGGGSSADLRAAFRAVREGPQEARRG